jgi:hypothetical protein
VVQVSRIEPRSDLLTFLRVAELVRREIPDVQFLHHGEIVDAAYWELVRTLHRNLLLGDTVRFEGPARDLARVLSVADVELGTSREEGFPWTIVAALLCERPVVAADPGGVRQVISGAGITTRPGDARALAEAVAATLRISPEQRAAIGRAGRDRALSRFRGSTFLDAYRAIYRELIGLPGERPAGLDAGRLPEAGVPGDTGADQGLEAAGPEVPGETVTGHGEVGGSGVEGREPVGPAPGEDRPAEAQVMEDSGTGGVRPPPGLSDPEPSVRVEALGLLEAPEEAELAAAALADAFPEVRREAVRAIGRLDGPLAGRWLADTVAHDPSAEVREEAVAALAELLGRPGTDEQLA